MASLPAFGRLVQPDTNILILRDWIEPDALPNEVAISAVTLVELSVGPHAVDGDDFGARMERARRTALLQRVESEFDPLAFDAPTARDRRCPQASTLHYQP